jgi:hypothetical protein
LRKIHDIYVQCYKYCKNIQNTVSQGLERQIAYSQYVSL